MDILAELTNIKAEFAANKESLATALQQATEFKASLEAKESALSDASTQLEANKAELEKVNTELAAKADELKAIQTALTELKAKEATAEQKAVEITASIGIAPMKVDAKAQGNAITREDALAHYAELLRGGDSKQAAMYFRDNESVILKGK